VRFSVDSLLLRQVGVAAVIAVAVLVIGPIAHPSSASTEIYSVSRDGSGLVNLTRNGADDFDPAHSPVLGRIAFVSDRDGYDAIYTIADDGSSLRRLTDRLTQEPQTTCRLRRPVWSPRGEAIAFTASCASPSSDPHGIYDSVCVVSSFGGLGPVLTLSPAGALASFSADGRFVAYTTKTNVITPTFVDYVAAEGGLPVRLGRGAAPSWSPTGHRLAFEQERHAVAVVDAAHPTTHWTYPNAGAPAWAPRGDVLAFWRDGARPGMYVVHPGRRRAARLVKLGTSAVAFWSPNGRWLALRAKSSLYVVARDGRSLRRVGGEGSDPVWSPDSSIVAWADASLGGLALSEPLSHETRVLARSSAISGLTWTLDSRRIVFASAP
jgi:Tol biopolymer transport system component